MTLDRQRGNGVLCSGSIVYDILVRPVDNVEWGTTSFIDALESHPGGNGANTSVALARIGVPVRLLGAIGNDDRGSSCWTSCEPRALTRARSLPWIRTLRRRW